MVFKFTEGCGFNKNSHTLIDAKNLNGAKIKAAKMREYSGTTIVLRDSIDRIIAYNDLSLWYTL